MPEKRATTIFFTDGSKLSLDFPKQSPNEYALAIKLEEVLKDRHLMFEADGAFLLIPFENIKYIQVYPAPENVPGHVYIKGATVMG